MGVDTRGYSRRNHGTWVRLHIPLSRAVGLFTRKTLICLAVILATRHHLPVTPPQYFNSKPYTSDSVPSLHHIALRTATRFSIPAKAHFLRLERERDELHSVHIKYIDETTPVYFIPDVTVVPFRYEGSLRSSTFQSRESHPRQIIDNSKFITISSSTLIIVPPNLVGTYHGLSHVIHSLI